MNFNDIIKAIGIEPYYRDWQSDIVIYNADCRDILPLIPDKSIDLVLTDPPYGIGFNEYESYQDNISGYKEFILPVIEKCEKLISNGWVGVFQTAKKCNEWHELIPRNWRIVACPKTFVQIYPVHGMTWATDYLLFWEIGAAVQRGKGRDWFVSDTANMKFDRGHPCARPLSQITYLIDNLSESGNIILDPFLGSGTTAVSCKKLGRKCIGIELEKKYCDIAVKRLAQGVLL